MYCGTAGYSSAALVLLWLLFKMQHIIRNDYIVSAIGRKSISLPLLLLVTATKVNRVNPGARCESNHLESIHSHLCSK